MKKGVLRRAVGYIHLLLGIGLGLVISVVCVSGALIVYKPSLEKLSIRDKAYIEVPFGQERMPLDSLYRRVREVYPTHSITNMVLYGDEHEAYSFRSTQEGEKGRRQIYINQYTGRVLGEDIYSTKWMQWLYDLHTRLLLGKAGVVIVGVVGLCLLLLLISGLWLIPRRPLRVLLMKSVKKHQSGYLRQYKLHLFLGIAGLIPLVIIAFTGAYWAFPSAYQSTFELLTQSQAVPHRPVVELMAHAKRATLDDIVASALRHYPGGEPTMIFFPKGGDAPFSVRMRHRRDYARTGSNHIYVHPQTAEVVGVNLWDDKPMAEKLVRSMYFIHFGEFWGHGSRLLWVLVGLLVPVMYFSGVYIWYRRVVRRRRRTSLGSVEV